MHRMKQIATFLCALAMLCVAAEQPVTPLLRGHSHNDYEQKRPLADALDAGFCSVEADVFLIEGELLVGHTVFGVRRERTLKSLYLDPLRKRVSENGGRVYRDGPAFYLMIDVKTDAATTWKALEKTLADYAPMLTTWRGEKIEPGAVTVIISGNRDRDALAKSDLRHAAIDGRLSDLKTNPPTTLVPWVSAGWTGEFKWTGEGAMPDDERAKLKRFVDEAHAQKRMIRFWEAPDMPAAWKELRDAGVDLINTDNLKGLAAFLQKDR
jgi:hypothetical protein